MKTIDGLWKQAIDDTIQYGNFVDSRLGWSRELIGWQGKLEAFDHTFLTNKRRKLSIEYAHAEVLWHLAGTNTLEMILAYAPRYDRWANHGEVWGAHGWRRTNDPGLLRETNGDGYIGCQLTRLIGLLRENKNDRRCVMTIWNGGDIVHALHNSKKDIPCMLTWQFLLRDGKLDMICTMRSNDIWLGMPYDIYTNTCFMRVIAWSLGAKMGRYIHQVGSLHLYEKYYDRAEEAYQAKIDHTPHGYNELERVQFFKEATRAVRQERVIRIGQQRIQLVEINPVFWDCVQICASKWIGINLSDIQSTLLRKCYVDSRR